MVVDGQAVKLKATRSCRPGNRKDRPVYSLAVVNILRALWKFYRFKCGKYLAVIIRNNIGFIGRLVACRRNSRPHHCKNDNCYAEQKNNAGIYADSSEIISAITVTIPTVSLQPSPKSVWRH